MTDDMVYLDVPLIGISKSKMCSAIYLSLGHVNACPCVVLGKVFAPRTLLFVNGSWTADGGSRVNFAHYKDRLGFARKRYPSVDFSGIPGVVCNNN